MQDDESRVENAPEDGDGVAGDVVPAEASEAPAEVPPAEAPGGDGPDRRSFLGGATLLMGAGLAAGYGTFAAYAGRYLYPARKDPRAWFFVADVASMRPGDSMTYVAPGGARVVIARQGAEEDAGSFMALSSVCPHLGCQVHWEGHNDRFFCPCHNGVFDPAGKGTGGPPGEAGQSLPRYPLKIEKGLLYIEVPLPSVAKVDDGGCGDGHDPCLRPCGREGPGERA